MNKHYFLSVAEVPRAPFGRYPEMSDISRNEYFLADVQRTEKKELQRMYSDDDFMNNENR
jgi:hypothetical protein